MYLLCIVIQIFYYSMPLDMINSVLSVTPMRRKKLRSLPTAGMTYVHIYDVTLTCYK